MRDITVKLGENAGKIWDVLSENGCLDKNSLITATKLSESEFNSAIGWLARENKISQIDANSYKLSDTNLEHPIGTHAGRVWKILDIWGDVDHESIKKLSDLEDGEVHNAIGWLACEDKLHKNEKNRYKLK